MYYHDFAFKCLPHINCSLTEKTYLHWVSRASWAGARIIQAQWTPEAIGPNSLYTTHKCMLNVVTELYDLLLLIFSGTEGKLANLEELQRSAGLNAEEWEALSQYTTQVLSNLVNYRSFGFTKILPRLSAEKFDLVVQKSANVASASPLWEKVYRFP
jgi:dipeptidyl-peptidase III